MAEKAIDFIYDLKMILIDRSFAFSHVTFYILNQDANEFPIFIEHCRYYSGIVTFAVFSKNLYKHCSIER